MVTVSNSQAQNRFESAVEFVKETPVKKYKDIPSDLAKKVAKARDSVQAKVDHIQKKSKGSKLESALVVGKKVFKVKKTVQKKAFKLITSKIRKK